MGNSVIAGRNASTAVGQYNQGLAASIFEIGIGSSDGDRKNALTVL
jgi:hypothetical protein